MKRIIRLKDFEIVGFRTGTRLEHAPQYAYKIVFTSPMTGQRLEMSEIYYKKKDAEKRVSYLAKIANYVWNNQTAIRSGEIVDIPMN